MKDKRYLHWEPLMKVVDEVPDNLDSTQKKETVEPEMRKILQKRCNNHCELCGVYKHYGCDGLQLHHVIPNGRSSEKNLLYLCIHCHRVVHLLLFLKNKWRHVMVSTNQPFA